MLRKVCGLTLLLLAVPTFAADISYNFIEAEYQEIDIDSGFLGGFDIDGDGYGIGGSFELNENWFIGASYSKADFDFGVDLDQLMLGAGYHVPISDNADFYGMFSFVSAEASIDGFDSIDEDGYAATIGLRGMIGERFELNGSLAYVDFGNGGDSTAFGAGALYNFSDAFAAGFSVGIDDDVTTYGIGFRVYFDR
jgi:outer membrane protein assembly factor BamA